MRILPRRARSSCQLPVTIYLVAVLLGVSAHAQSPSFNEQVDHIARDVLASTGVPSASVAIVRDDQLAYTHAYGDASLAPRVPARSEMRYSIGSISKQFTATAILLLADQGKLSLHDPVSRFVPELTRANEVTIRQLLSHTSGYQDYWPQDYVMPMMLQPVTAQRILDLWARKPLDFDPGTKWQYSNTNYVIAGLIVEKASGMPLLKFLAGATQYCPPTRATGCCPAGDRAADSKARRVAAHPWGYAYVCRHQSAESSAANPAPEISPLREECVRSVCLCGRGHSGGH